MTLHAPALWPLLRAPVTRFFDELADGWDERNQAASAEHLAPLAAGATHVRPPPERVLDVGTGTGVGALMLAREFPGARVRGVDVSEQMLRAARRKVGLDPEGRIAFREADAARLPFDDESFDLVTQLNMPVFAAELARVTRRGGHVLVASSLGADTPFHTPHGSLARSLGRRGLVVVLTDEVAAGCFLLARRDGAATA